MNHKSLFHKHIAQTSPESIGLEIERAKGIYLYGPNGQKWIDFISGICVMNVGHGAPEVLEAVEKQSKAYLHTMVYGEAIQAPQVELADFLIRELDSRLDRVYFTNSGAEATEGALKIAKKFTGRAELISCFGAYHGSTHGALSVGGNPKKKVGYGPMLPQVKHIRFNSVEDLSQITEKTAAFIVEPIQGTGGIILPEPGYFQTVRERCDETGTLLIMDEIQTGYGRVGEKFAHHLYEVEPDILLLAKSLGGGIPLGAFISRTEIFEVIQQNPVLGHITTFGGNPLSCAAGLASFQKIVDEDIIAQIPAKEQILHQRLVHPSIKLIRGAGLLYAMLFEDYAFAEGMRRALLKAGLVTLGFINIDNGLRIAPPLTITEAELHHCCDIIIETLDHL
jgi:acetylornithine/N-succinyldiaminopimelate aminotransferase